jgi:hypothetical protein
VTVYAGQPLLAADVQAERNRERFIPKTGAQDHLNDATLQNDTELTCSMEANSTYVVRIHASIGGTDGDIQTAWSAPTNSSGSKQCFGPEAGSTDRTNTNMRASNHAFATAVTYGVASLTSLAAVIEVGRIDTTEAGTFTWQHAQNSSTGNASTIGANSFMIVTKVA